MGVDFLDFLRSGEKDVHAFAESRRKRRPAGAMPPFNPPAIELVNSAPRAAEGDTPASQVRSAAVREDAGIR